MHAGTREQVLDGTDINVGLTFQKKWFYVLQSKLFKMMKNDFYYLKSPIYL